MGTDIHGVIQHRHDRDKIWRVVGEIEGDRNYRVFAMLAGVRNGFGFAGVPTHEAIEPISAPRGIPEDLCTDGEGALVWDDYGTQKQCWLGDHSFSWLMLDEVVNWPGWKKDLAMTGIVEKDEYLAMKAEGRTRPESWCGGVTGPDVLIVENEETENRNDWTHVRYYWTVPFTASAETFHAWIKYMQLKYGGFGELRLVFGFDS